MAQFLRKAEARGDMKATVGDLVKIYEQVQIAKKTGSPRKSLDPAAERTGQWNAFVKDFSKDPQTKYFSSRLKAAALLWGHVRDRAGSKKYTRRLLLEFNKELEKYKK